MIRVHAVVPGRLYILAAAADVQFAAVRDRVWSRYRFKVRWRIIRVVPRTGGVTYSRVFDEPEGDERDLQARLIDEAGIGAEYVRIVEGSYPR